MYCWGRNATGVANPQDDILHGPSPIPALISALPPASQLDVSGSNACVVTNSEGLVCWGEKEISPGTYQAQPAPFPIPGLESGVASLSLNGQVCVVTTATDVLCGLQREFDLQPVCRDVSCLSTLTGVESVSASTLAACAVVDGGVKCWGENLYGILGDGTTIDSIYPVDVCRTAAEAPSPCIEPLTGVQEVSVSDFHACALMTGGTVYCWGSVPTVQFGQVEGITNAVQGAAGSAHDCALLSTGSVSCWGFNLSGQLGIGYTSWAETPTSVIGIPDTIVSIDVLGSQSCAVSQNGDVYCWGRNDQGQLGDGPSTVSTPQLFSGLSEDTDSDGVPDAVDACPDEAGSATNGGCPFPPSIGGTVEILVTGVDANGQSRTYLLILALLVSAAAVVKLALAKRR